MSATPLKRRIASTDQNLAEAVALLKRGKRCMQRVGWESGETDREWISAVSAFLSYLEQDREMARMRDGAAS
jgi:hypothetical protein